MTDLQKIEEEWNSSSEEEIPQRESKALDLKQIQEEWSSSSEEDKEIRQKRVLLKQQAALTVQKAEDKIRKTEPTSQTRQSSVRRVSDISKIASAQRRDADRRKSSISGMTSEFNTYLDDIKPTLEEKSEESSSSSSEPDEEIDQIQGHGRSIPVFKRKPNHRQGQNLDVKKEEKPHKKEDKRDREIFELIEVSERQNLTDFEKKIEINSEVLTTVNEVKDYKIKNLRVDQLLTLQEALSCKQNKYYSDVTCIASHGKYLFVGCVSGFIRVFNIESRPLEDLKPLVNVNKSQPRSSVTTIDVSPGMLFLLSGHQNGTISVWDLKKFKLLCVINDAHTSEIRSVKFYSTQEENTLGVISVEANGPVRKIEVDKSSSFLSLGTKPYQIQVVYQKRLKNPTSIQVVLPSGIKNQDYWQDQNLCAIVAVSEVIVATMRTVSEELKIKRPQGICKLNCVPTVSFGFGFAPSQKNTKMLLLAIAWDSLVQLVVFDDCRLEVVQDGLYYTEDEIDVIQFVADSTLMVWSNKKIVKLLDTKKFQTGDFKRYEKSDDTQTAFDPNLMSLIDVSAEAEIQQDSSCQFKISRVKGQQQEGPDQTLVINFANSVATFKRQTYFISQTECRVTRLSTRSYQEYLQTIATEDKSSWLQQLKAATQIYLGNIPGFFNVPSDQGLRHSEMANYMKDFLLLNLKSALDELLYLISSEKEREYKISKNDVETIIIRAATEYCLIIKQPSFLFREVYNFLQQGGLEKSFIKCLAAFFKSGRLREILMQDSFIKKILQYCEEEHQFDLIERTVVQINLSSYSYTQELQALCEQHRLVRAQGHILMDKCNSGGEKFTFLATLAAFYKMMQSASQVEQKSRQDLKDKFHTVNKSDLQNIDRTGQALKSELERSYIYLGYKVLWFIKQLISGKQGLEKDLTEADYRSAIYDVVGFVMQEDFLEDILQFDAESFFKVITGLFSGVPWKFMLEFNIYRPNKRPIQVFKEIETKIEKFKIVHNKIDTSDAFYQFVLQVVTNSQKDGLKTDQVIHQSTKSSMIDYSIIFYALKCTIERLANVNGVAIENSQKLDYVKSQEHLILSTLRQVQIQRDDLETLIKLTDLQTDYYSFINIKVVLFEIKKDYVQAFKCLLQSVTKQHKVFEWLKQIFTTLQEEGSNNDINSLKAATKMHMREMILLEVSIGQKRADANVSSADKKNISKMQSQVGSIPQNQDLQCQMCLFIISKYFDEPDYITYLVTEELSQYPIQQMQFLKTFTLSREQQIANVVNEAVYSPELQSTAQFYQNLLIILTQRLCERQADDKLEKSEREADDILKWVDKDYFPTRECMEVCRQNNVLHGQALLINKLGDGMQAIRLYNNFLLNFDTKRMTDQLLLVNQRDWDFGRGSGYRILSRFDKILEKAYIIAGQLEKDGYRFVYGEEGWFLILEFLQKLFVDASQKIEEAKVDNASKPGRLEMIRNFYSMRISFVLKRDDIKLSLRSVADRLSLHYEQIKNLCIDSHSKLKGDRARVMSYNDIQYKDVYTMFLEYDEACANGFPVYSYLVGKSDKQKYVSLDKCQLCNQSVLDSAVVFPFESFSCGHLYHIGCLREMDYCSKCSQKRLLYKPFEDELEEDQEHFKETFDNTKGIYSVQQIAQNMKEVSQQQRNKVINRQLNLLDSSILDKCLQVTDFKDHK